MIGNPDKSQVILLGTVNLKSGSALLEVEVGSVEHK